MEFQSKVKIIQLDGKSRFTDKIENERLRGIDWTHLQQNHPGQILWGTVLNVKFDSFDKTNDTAILKEVSKQDLESKKLEEPKIEPKKELLPKSSINQEEIEQQKREKSIEYESILEEVKELTEWKNLENDFTIKFVSGPGVYFLVASKKDKDLMFNICGDTGWVSYKELNSKTKMIERKYDPICKGKMTIEDYKKSLIMIRKDSEFKVNLNLKK